jgi:hypothetical protein
MKNLFDRFLLFGMICVLFIPACNNEDPKNCNCDDQNYTAQFISMSDCKSGAKSTQCNTSETCVEFSYDPATGNLLITHLNAAFNCCPDSVNLNFQLRNDTIFIAETEESSLCNCDCLYDLDFKLSSIEAKEYVLNFTEPYCCDQVKLIVSINLAETINGQVCVERTQYPWGVQ